MDTMMEWPLQKPEINFEFKKSIGVIKNIATNPLRRVQKRIF